MHHSRDSPGANDLRRSWSGLVDETDGSGVVLLVSKGMFPLIMLISKEVELTASFKVASVELTSLQNFFFFFFTITISHYYSPHHSYSTYSVQYIHPLVMTHSYSPHTLLALGKQFPFGETFDLWQTLISP